MRVKGLGALAGSLALLVACAGQPHGRRVEAFPAHAGPIVLVTLAGLRADVVGSRLTPTLHSLAAEADWAGRAVAPSGFALASLGTLATGLSPWDHGAVEVGRAALAAELRTLPEALAERGYRNSAYVAGPWLEGPGWKQGFGVHRRLGGGGRAAGHLQSLAGTDRQFLWLHLGDAEPTWPRRAWLLPRLGKVAPLADGTPLAARLPRQVTARALEVYRDPAVPLPPERRRVLDAMYRLAVAHADDRLGELLAALRESGAWDDTLLVVTAPYGETLGPLPPRRGAALARGRLEVPLVVKLPRSLRGAGVRVAAAGGSRPAPQRGTSLGAVPPVALARVWATLVAAAGGAVPPAAAPGLLAANAPAGAEEDAEEGAAPDAILSEAYLGNGTNALSLVASDGGTTWQLVRRVRFADPEPAYHAARLATYRHRAPPDAPDPAVLFGRLTAAFDRVPPLAGRGGAAETLLLRWLPGGGVEPVDDPRRAAALAERLERRWLAFTGCDAAPGVEDVRRARERAVPAAAAP